MERIICLVMGYVFGLFQTGYIYGKVHGIDIRQHGSGNSGSTNALRVMGVKAGAMVFLGDFLKTVIPCFLVRIFFRNQPEFVYVLILYTGFGVILGHNFPCYLKFKGGKGIAATAGIIFSLDWRLTLLCLAAFVLIVAVTKYVSLGSLIVSTIFFCWNVVFGNMGAYGLSRDAMMEFYIVSFVIAAMAFWRHRANIVRLAQGKENKVGAKKDK
ncbi:MAG: glycerol-3-phosphate 1-O-acyltransferase PlsY [Clostridium sp.]|nr:glycerol-3-phosphate 1-O-acyltransferase PlsY [Clostridium sp.]